VLPLLGGVLIDHFPASKMLIVFSIFTCIGQGIFVYGILMKSVWTLVLGRFIFGIGCECLEIAQVKITTDWFKARWLGFALGISLSFSRMATTLNDNLSPIIASKGGGIVVANWVGFAICVLSVLCGFILSYIDRTDSRSHSGVRENLKVKKKKSRPLSRKDYIIGRQAINASTDSTMTLSPDALEEEDAVKKEIEMAEDDKMLYSEISSLGANFWILCLCCISLYGNDLEKIV
jgi:MFS family permease